MNASDWVQATGHPVVGRGGRPLNPKLLPHLVTKARSTRSSAVVREARRAILRAAQLTGAIDDQLSPPVTRRGRTVRDANVYEQSRPGSAGLAAQLRHQAAVARARKL